jgi:hypothetical protein
MYVFDWETLAFLAVNDAAVRQYGYSRQEFLALTALDIRPAEDRPRFLQRKYEAAKRDLPSAPWVESVAVAVQATTE